MNYRNNKYSEYITLSPGTGVSGAIIKDYRTDLALNKVITASSTETGVNVIENINDADNSTRWSSLYSDEQVLTVDLEDVYYLSDVVLNWEAASAKKYKLERSENGIDWTTVNTESEGNGGVDKVNVYVTPAR